MNDHEMIIFSQYFKDRCDFPHTLLRSFSQNKAFEFELNTNGHFGHLDYEI